MNERTSRLLGGVIAVIVAVFPAFFCVFNAVFSDVSSQGERLLTFALVFAAYAVLGLIFGYVWPGVSYWWGLWLGIPALLILIWYSTHEPGQILLHIAYIAVTIASGCLGGYAGAWLRLRMGQRNGSQT